MPERPYSIEDQRRADAVEQEAARIKASQDFGRLNRLMQNEDWTWFVETHLLPIVERERRSSRKLADGKDKVWEHSHRLEVAEEITGKLAEEHARLERAARIGK